MFGWTYLDQDGQQIGRSPRFPDTESAESWLGLSWTDLHENGVEEVVLFDHVRGRRVYRMGLAAE
ncbi:MAG TPA: hypothetical protein VE669_03700 [Actinomycetota bacterium]|jgi:hypothetical protein|nr:hypothetical protein [Actinomycetota bacterium]